MKHTFSISWLRNKKKIDRIKKSNVNFYNFYKYYMDDTSIIIFNSYNYKRSNTPFKFLLDFIITLYKPG